MTVRNYFNEVLRSINGFYSCWVAQVGVELGLFRQLSVHQSGLSSQELARCLSLPDETIANWCMMVLAFGLLDHANGKFRLLEDAVPVLVDEHSLYYLGGQLLVTTSGSLDYAELREYFRTSKTIPMRNERFMHAIAAATSLDIDIFLEEAFHNIPALADRFSQEGVRVVDLGCGAGLWISRLAAQFPHARFVGVDSDSRAITLARKNVQAAGVHEQVELIQADATDCHFDSEFDIAYLQESLRGSESSRQLMHTACHVLRSGGMAISFEWPFGYDKSRIREPIIQLAWGVQMDELLHGSSLLTTEQIADIFLTSGFSNVQQFYAQAGALITHGIKPQ